MIQRNVPQSMTDAPEPETAGVAETARVQNLDPNLCPICGNMMITAIASGHNVRMCADHNIVMPVPDA